MPAKKGVIARNRIDLAGMKFGMLTATAETETRGKVVYWKCACDCGGYRMVVSQSLRNGVTWNCGCQPNSSRLKAGDRTRTHGMAASRTYTIWCCMKGRGKATKGAYRTVSVCDRWMVFENFLSDMGEAPNGMSIDRIDNSIGYQPGNCRWATRSTQNNNRSNNIVITHGGKTATLAQWAAELGKPYGRLYARFVKRGWSEEATLLTP